LKLISAQEVAKIMGCAESTIRTNAKKGTLGFTAVKVGSLWKFRDSDVYEYVYGKDWKRIVFGIVGEEPDTPEIPVKMVPLSKPLQLDPEPVAEPEPSPAPMSARPTNVIPLGAQEVKFEE
jgi:excisionase family DNA binding protein